MGPLGDLDIDKIRLFIADHEKTLRMIAVIAVIFLSVLFFWTRGSGETVEIDAPSQEQDSEQTSEQVSDDGSSRMVPYQIKKQRSHMWISAEKLSFLVFIR